MCPGHSTSDLWLDVMVLHHFVLGNVVHKGMVMNIYFFHSRWLTQINPPDTETGSTVLTSWWLPAACLNRADDSQRCSSWAMSPSFKIILIDRWLVPLLAFSPAEMRTEWTDWSFCTVIYASSPIQLVLRIYSSFIIGTNSISRSSSSKRGWNI